MYFSWQEGLWWVFVTATLVAVCGLLIAAASLVAENKLQGTGSVAVVQGLSYSAAQKILWDLPRPGIKPASPYIARRILTLDHQGRPQGKCEFPEFSGLTLLYHPHILLHPNPHGT